MFVLLMVACGSPGSPDEVAVPFTADGLDDGWRVGAFEVDGDEPTDASVFHTGSPLAVAAPDAGELVVSGLASRDFSAHPCVNGDFSWTIDRAVIVGAWQDEDGNGAYDGEPILAVGDGMYGYEPAGDRWVVVSGGCEPLGAGPVAVAPFEVESAPSPAIVNDTAHALTVVAVTRSGDYEAGNSDCAEEIATIDAGDSLAALPDIGHLCGPTDVSRETTVLVDERGALYCETGDPWEAMYVPDPASAGVAQRYADEELKLGWSYWQSTTAVSSLYVSWPERGITCCDALEDCY